MLLISIELNWKKIFYTLHFVCFVLLNVICHSSFCMFFKRNFFLNVSYLFFFRIIHG